MLYIIEFQGPHAYLICWEIDKPWEESSRGACSDPERVGMLGMNLIAESMALIQS